MNSMTSQIKQRMRERRFSLGLSQREIACALGCSHAAYSNLERGNTALKVHVLQKVAAVLHVELLWLLFGEQVTAPATYLDLEARLRALEERDKPRESTPGENLCFTAKTKRRGTDE